MCSVQCDEQQQVKKRQNTQHNDLLCNNYNLGGCVFKTDSFEKASDVMLK